LLVSRLTFSENVSTHLSLFAGIKNYGKWFVEPEKFGAKFI